MPILTRAAAAAVVFALLPWAAAASDFVLESPTVAEGKSLPSAHVFNDWGCGGANRSPALSWRGAPAGTKSFAVTVFDPDAPTGSGWWHWLVINLPASATGLPEGAGSADAGALPPGALQGPTDFDGARAFGGACPPPGKPHRYQITVYAMGVERFDPGPKATAATYGFVLNSRALAKATLTATYARP